MSILWCKNWSTRLRVVRCHGTIAPDVLQVLWTTAVHFPTEAWEIAYHSYVHIPLKHYASSLWKQIMNRATALRHSEYAQTMTLIGRSSTTATRNFPRIERLPGWNDTHASLNANLSEIFKTE